MAQYVSEENLKQYDKLLKEYIQTKSESLLDLLSYGVEWDTEVADPHLTRIGNLNWHRTLPIQSQMRRCIAQKEKIMYWLDPNDGRFREDNKDYIFTSEVSTIVENDITYYTITDSTRFSDLGYKRQYVKINGIIGQIIDISNNTAKIKLENTLDAGTYEIELGSRTNGYDGTVEVYVPEFYIRSFINGTKRQVRISPFQIDSSWQKQKRCLLSAFKCTVLNTVPEDMGYLSTLPVNSAISVANVETYCRGGGNREEYDQYLETDPFRTDLGKCRSNISRIAMRTYARNAGKEILNYIQYKNILYWLWVIEYANFDVQETYKPELTDLGYKQGGMGMGVTNVHHVNLYNKIYSIIPNGYTLDVQYGTGIKRATIVTPKESDENSNYIEYTNVPVWRYIENLFGDIGIGLDGVIVQGSTKEIPSAVYVTNNPDYYGDNTEAKSKMQIAGHITNSGGFIKEFDLGIEANIIPSSVGGSSTTYMCDENINVSQNINSLRSFKINSDPGYSKNAGICFISTAGGIEYSSNTTSFRLIKEIPETEYMVITSNSNAPLMTAMYNAGLASNPDYMTKSEAEKVTTLNGIDFTNVVSFDEFKYFTGVTEIPNLCFYNNTNLTSIICPDSLVTIGDRAFGGCSNLSYIKIGKYVTSIDSYVFGGCAKLTAVIIPNFVTTIGEGAFQYCYGLKSIKLSNSLTSISKYMFRECTSLESVIIPDSVTTIDDSAFYHCSSLTSINIPDSVTTIGKLVFFKSGLTSVTIGNSVTSIGDNAFSISKLTSITIPNSVTSIGNSLFSYCIHLGSIVVESDNPVYDSRNNCNAIIETATNKLLYGCKNTIIPNSVISIGNSAFAGQFFTQMIIPDSVTSIGWEAFSECNLITSITIPNSVTTIGDYAFQYCKNLTSIEIGNSITSIGNGTFRNCSSLSSIKCLATTAPTVKSVTFGNSDTSYTGLNTHDQGVNKLYIPAGATGYDTGAWLDPLQNAEKCGFTIELLYAVKRETNPELMDICVANNWSANKDYMTFEEAAAITSDMIAPNEEYESKFKTLTHFEEFQYFTGVKEIKDSTFYYCNSLTSIEIPDSVTSIGNSAFEECYKLINITIPNSITSIGDSAFYNCSLTTITIPNSVTSIGDSAFGFCESLTSINIPNSITSINSYIFSDCYSLTSIIIPDSVTSINDGAFSNCSSLTSINIPNSINYIGEDVFNNCSNLNTIVVQEGNTVYNSRNNCNAIIETNTNTLIIGCKNTIIPNSVTSIGNSAFYGCKSLTSITIPDLVTSVGDYAFQGCSGLTSITIPDSVTSIGNSAFSGCKSLTSITIPNFVTSIGNYTFSNCSGLISVIYNAENCTTRSSIFSSCTNLTSLTIGDKVKSIPSSIFANCSGLTSVIIPNSVTSIGNYAFKNCSGLTSIQFNAENYSNSKYNSWLYNCNNITSFTFGENVKIIPAYLCYNLTKLTSVVIGNSVTSIGEEAFYNCSSLTSIEIPNSVTSIGLSAFRGCSSLTSVIIGNSVTSIGQSAFYYCSSLSSIIIPDSVTSISYYAFSGCSSLFSITCLATTAPTVESSTFGDSDTSYAGRNTYNQGINKLKVPQGATGYDTGAWLDPLQNSSKCGFTIEYI